MDPYGSPYIIPSKSPQYPFPHSLLSTGEYFQAFGPEDLTMSAFWITYECRALGCRAVSGLASLFAAGRLLEGLRL